MSKATDWKIRLDHYDHGVSEVSIEVGIGRIDENGYSEYLLVSEAERRINAHDGLVEALKRLRGVVVKTGQGVCWTDFSWDTEARSAVNEADLLLAAVGGTRTGGE
jgi:hypothetical protein